MRKLIVISLLFFLTQANAEEITQEQADIFNALRSEANNLVSEYLVIQGKKPKAPNKKKILKGIDLYNQALDIYPYHWQTHWTIGKAYQAIMDFDNGYYSFKRAYELNKDHPDVLNELLIAMIDSGRLKEAIELGNEGITNFPERFGIRANIAVAHLLLGELDKSITEAEKALEANPGDSITELIVKTAKEIQIGQRKQPSSMKELLDGI